MIEGVLRKSISEVLDSLGMTTDGFSVEHPTDSSHGDYATNVAMRVEGNPKENAEKIAGELKKKNIDSVEKIEIAGPGFINFYLTRDFFAESIKTDENFGRNEILKGDKVMIEYTDPNPFKEFHIGHLMSNAVGESLSRLIEFSGAEIKRANYQGDVGVHVAKAIWGKLHNPQVLWGEAYAIGAKEYKNNKEEIDALNKKIYERADKEMNALYDQGKQASLDMFEKMYEKLGTKFDEYFFESEVAETGKKIVEENPDVFEKGDGGAIVYKGEQDGLHTRVFINAQGIPTYEAKELGLAKLKYEKYQYDTSVVVTANEVDSYFKVLLAVMNKIFPELAEKTVHKSHGVMKLPTGKMSSRTGDVISAEGLIEEVKNKVLEKMTEKDEGIAEKIAVGALKYSILRQAIGHDIVFELEKALSFEGDSGPYLQYAHVRARAVLEKAKEAGINPSFDSVPEEVSPIEKILYRFPEVVEKASGDYAPHYVVTYLTELAGAFNAYYEKQRIVDEGDKHSSYRVAVVEAVANTLKNGLWVLGIAAPEKM